MLRYNENYLQYCIKSHCFVVHDFKYTNRSKWCKLSRLKEGKRGGVESLARQTTVTDGEFKKS